MESQKRKNYFNEEFNLSKNRLDIFGPDNKCPKCEGTSWIPVSKSCIDQKLRSLWVQAEEGTPTQDGWHIVPCPKCSPIQNGSLSEHIVKVGNKFELKSKKTGKNLGTYTSRSGAKHREAEVEYFKHMHEDYGMLKTKEDVHEKVINDENGALKNTENGKPLPWRLHEDWPLPGHPADTGHSNFKREKDNGEFKHGVSEASEPTNTVKKQDENSHQQSKSDQKNKENSHQQSKSDQKNKEKQKRQNIEQQRQSKKLLPYEFTNQKDAEISAGYMGINGAHATGGGLYKPGSSDQSLRDAVYRKRSKQHMTGHKFFKEETTKRKESQKDFDKGTSAIRGDSHDAYALDKANCHEDLFYTHPKSTKEDRDYMWQENPKEKEKLTEVVRKIKELAGNFPGPPE